MWRLLSENWTHSPTNHLYSSGLRLNSMSVCCGKWSFGKYQGLLKYFLHFNSPSFFLLSCLRVSICTSLGLSTPRGLHFSEVTDSSAVVHWSLASSPVDSYRITYVLFEGGKGQSDWFTFLAFLHFYLTVRQCRETETREERRVWQASKVH